MNITEERFGIPCNAWARDKRLKKLGALVMRNEVALVKCLAKFLRLVVEDEREARAIEEGAKGDFRNLNMHFIKDMWVSRPYSFPHQSSKPLCVFYSRL